MKPDLSRLGHQLRNNKPIIIQKTVNEKKKGFSWANLFTLIIAVASLGYAIFSGYQQSITTKKQTELLDLMVNANENLLKYNTDGDRSTFTLPSFKSYYSNCDSALFVQLCFKNTGKYPAEDLVIEIISENKIHYKSNGYVRVEERLKSNGSYAIILLKDNFKFVNKHFNNLRLLVKISWKDNLTKIIDQSFFNIHFEIETDEIFEIENIEPAKNKEEELSKHFSFLKKNSNQIPHVFFYSYLYEEYRMQDNLELFKDSLFFYSVNHFDDLKYYSYRPQSFYQYLFEAGIHFNE